MQAPPFDRQPPKNAPPSAADTQYLEALEQLRLVNEIFVRARRYRNLPGASGTVAGFLALCGGFFFWWNYGSVHHAPGAFILTWAFIFLLALCGHLFFSFQNARHQMEPLVSEVALLLAQTIIPIQIVAVVVPVALYKIGEVRLLAGFWMLFYGIGVLSCRPYIDSWVVRFGWAFVLLGSVQLLWLPAYGNELMTLGFGLTHLMYGFKMRRKTVP